MQDALTHFHGHLHFHQYAFGQRRDTDGGTRMSPRVAIHRHQDRSDAPLITCGTSMKSGVTLTNPFNITTCFSASNEPTAALTMDNKFNAQISAASCASASVLSPPALPVMRVPSALTEIAPDKNNKLPDTSKG